MVSVNTQVTDDSSIPNHQENHQRQQQRSESGGGRPTLIDVAVPTTGPRSGVSIGGQTSVSSLSTLSSSPTSDYWSKRHLKDRKSRRSILSSTTTRGSNKVAQQESTVPSQTDSAISSTPGAFHVSPSNNGPIGTTQEEEPPPPASPSHEAEDVFVGDAKIGTENPTSAESAQIVQAELAPDTSAIVAQEVRRQVQKELQRHYNGTIGSDEVLVVADTTKVLPNIEEANNEKSSNSSRSTSCCYLNRCWICCTSLLFILVLILGLTVSMMLRNNGGVETGNNENNSQFLTSPPEDIDVLQPTMSPTQGDSSLRGSLPTNLPSTLNVASDRDTYCSSPNEQVGMTLQSWYLGHEDGRGSGQGSNCEELCRQDERCNSWMWRNSGNTCYLSEDKKLKEIPSGGGCCTDHHAFTFNEANCLLQDESPSPSPSSFPPAVHNERSSYCSSSSEQKAMTLQSWYFGHTNGGSGLWSQCEQLCRDDPRCNSWMGRNSGNTCYLSEDATLKPISGTCCSDHHPYTFNLDNCDSDHEKEQESWEIIEGGGIGIGPGSYYTDDEAITLIDSNIDKEATAWELVRSYDSTDNPIVMWQIQNIPNGKDGRSRVEFWAHRLQFMYQNLDAATGSSPRDFAQDTAQFIESTQGPGNGGAIRVRSDAWWQSNKQN